MWNVNLAVCTIVSMICCHVANSQLDPEDVEKINSFMAELMECRQMPGSAIALLKVGVIHFLNSYKYAEVCTLCLNCGSLSL